MFLVSRLPLLLACAAALSAGPKVLVMSQSASAVQALQSAVPEVKLVAATQATVANEIADADAVIGSVRPEDLRAAKKLRWVHVTSAGVEKALFPELIDSEIVVTNAKNVYGPQIADHAFAFLLTLTRRLNATIPEQVKEEWPSGREGMFELEGKTAVIIGAGGIGGHIARRAHGFGMKTIAVDPRDLTSGIVSDQVVHPDRLNSVLPEADVVFMSAPHTRKTEGMMGSKQFELMKKGSYFIAVSRGKTYSMDALVKALDERRLAGAGVDVTDPEPLPKGHALWKFKNVVITPHTAGGSDQLAGRIRNLLVENLKRFANGETLLNVVDKREGY